LKSFQSLVVLQCPQQQLWTTMRDHLSEFADRIDDIEGIRQIDRRSEPDGRVHVVNEWHIRQQLPPAVRSILKSDELRWIDRNTWDAATWICDWTIEPVHLSQYIACSGQTVFTATMAGRGTRVTFNGELDLKPGLLASLGGYEPLLTGVVESVVTTIIPRNLRNVAEAAAAFVQPTTRSAEQHAVVKTKPRVGK